MTTPQGLALSRNELLERFYPMVKSVVHAMSRTLPDCADLDELESVGVSGLVAAVQRYDAEREETFERYVYLRIRGAILDELRRMDAMPRSSRRKVRRYQSEVERIEQQLGRPASEEEIRSGMGLTPAEFARLRRAVQPVSRVSFDAEGTEEAVMRLATDSRSGEAQEPAYATVEREEYRRYFTEKIGQLVLRQQKVLAMYYYEGMRLADIAAVFGVTEARICQIHGQAINNLRKLLRKD